MRVPYGEISKNMFYKTKNEYFTFKEAEKEGLLFAVSSKEDGNMSLKYGDKKEVLGNRTKFIKKVGLNSPNNKFFVVKTGFECKLFFTDQL